MGEPKSRMSVSDLLIGDDSLDAEDMARLKKAREHAADVLRHVEESPRTGPLSRDLNDNESILAWAVAYQADVIESMKGVLKAAASSERTSRTFDVNALARYAPVVTLGLPGMRQDDVRGQWVMLADVIALLTLSESARSDPTPCGCIETYPQLIRGRVSHHADCPNRSVFGWVDVEKAKADAYEDAIGRVEKLAEDYTHEHGSYDSSTNAWELHHRHGDRIEAWDDAVDALRKRKAEKCQVTQALQPGAIRG